MCSKTAPRNEILSPNGRLRGEMASNMRCYVSAMGWLAQARQAMAALSSFFIIDGRNRSPTELGATTLMSSEALVRYTWPSRPPHTTVQESRGSETCFWIQTCREFADPDGCQPPFVVLPQYGNAE